MEPYIDDESLRPLPDRCPLMVEALSLFETLLLSLSLSPSLRPAFPLPLIQSLWDRCRPFLSPSTDGSFLAAFLRLAAAALRSLHEDALFLVQDLLALLPASLQNINERCRAESCRVLGWLCQVFPAVPAANRPHL